MKRRVLFPALCSLLAVVFILSSGMSTYALWAVSGETINALTIASVHGAITEEFEQGETYYPGADVTKKVQVENTGEIDVVVRVKIEKAWGVRGSDGVLIPDPDLSTDNIEIEFNDVNWYYNPDDGYFYYKGVLPPGGITESLFDSFHIDDRTGAEHAGKDADIIVTMECVQAGGNGISYWGMEYADLGITYVESEPPGITTTVELVDLDVGFRFEMNDGDLFANFKDLVPGTSRSQEITITNSWTLDAEIFLWADNVEQVTDDPETLERIYQLLKEHAQIVITNSNGDVIYSGPVWGALDVTDVLDGNTMKDPISLGVFAPGDTETLYVALTVDNRITSEEAELLALVKWLFKAQGDFPEEPSSDEESNPSSGTSSTPTDPSSGGGKKTDVVTPIPPNTGDTSNLVLWICLTIASGLGFIFLLMWGKKNKKEQSNP